MNTKPIGFVGAFIAVLAIGVLYSAFTPRGIGGFACNLGLPRSAVSWNAQLAVQWDKQYTYFLSGTPNAIGDVGK